MPSVHYLMTPLKRRHHNRDGNTATHGVILNMQASSLQGRSLSHFSSRAGTATQCGCGASRRTRCRRRRLPKSRMCNAPRSARDRPEIGPRSAEIGPTSARHRPRSAQSACILENISAHISARVCAVGADAVRAHRLHRPLKPSLRMARAHRPARGTHLPQACVHADSWDTRRRAGAIAPRSRRDRTGVKPRSRRDRVERLIHSTSTDTDP